MRAALHQWILDVIQSGGRSNEAAPTMTQGTRLADLMGGRSISVGERTVLFGCGPLYCCTRAAWDRALAQLAERVWQSTDAAADAWRAVFDAIDGPVLGYQIEWTRERAIFHWKGHVKGSVPELRALLDGFEHGDDDSRSLHFVLDAIGASAADSP